MQTRFFHGRLSVLLCPCPYEELLPAETVLLQCLRSAVFLPEILRYVWSRTPGRQVSLVLHIRSNDRPSFRFCDTTAKHRSADTLPHGRTLCRKETLHTLSCLKTTWSVLVFPAGLPSTPADAGLRSNGCLLLTPAWDPLHRRSPSFAFPNGSSIPAGGTPRFLSDTLLPETGLPSQVLRWHVPDLPALWQSLWHDILVSVHFYKLFHVPHQ